jgi:hypothetical protein
LRDEGVLMLKNEIAFYLLGEAIYEQLARKWEPQFYNFKR